MLFTISGKHIDITEAIRKYAEQKTSKLPKYYNSINQVEVVIDGAQAGSTGVQIIAKAEHSKIFIVNEAGQDACKCIDIAVHKLERQLRRKKTRERDNKHTGSES